MLLLVMSGTLSFFRDFVLPGQAKQSPEGMFQKSTFSLDTSLSIFNSQLLALPQALAHLSHQREVARRLAGGDIARARQVDSDEALDPAGPGRHHHHAVGSEHRPGRAGR